MFNVARGEVWLVNLGDGYHSEQGGVRPCLIVQNDNGNLHSPTTIVLPITTQKKSFNLTHVNVELAKPSSILCEQIMVIDKVRLMKRLTVLGEDTMRLVESKIMISLGMGA